MIPISCSFSKSDKSFFYNNFDVIAKSVSSLEEAEIICLPEEHTNENHLTKNAWLIDRLYKGGILLEEGSSPEELKNANRFYTRKFSQRGWDSPEAAAKLEALLQAPLTLCEELDSLSFKEFETHFFQFLSYFSSSTRPVVTFNEKYANAESEEAKKDVMSEFLLKILETMKTSGPIFLLAAFEKLDEETIPLRTNSLIEELEKASSEGMQTFVNGGLAHFILSQERPLYAPHVERLHDFLKGKKFVILKANEHPEPFLKFQLLMKKNFPKLIALKEKCQGSASILGTLGILLLIVGLTAFLLYARGRLF